ncbi:hypothetical protein M407DRAFT_44189, partial [Tulasnella calospora MUT 4182]
VETRCVILSANLMAFINEPLRWKQAILRWTYSVPFPNSLWHIDGHHKLIRWKIVTHGGIDGKSRLV